MTVLTHDLLRIAHYIQVMKFILNLLATYDIYLTVGPREIQSGHVI